MDNRREPIPCLREASEADIPAIVAVLRAAFEEYRGQLSPPSGAHSETEARIRQKLLEARAVLALDGEQVIGCVFYQARPEHLYLSRLGVLPAYRRRGIGRLLIDYVEERARALNLSRVRLGVRTALPQNRAYYQALGYTREVMYGVHEGYIEPTYVIVEKDLC